MRRDPAGTRALWGLRLFFPTRFADQVALQGKPCPEQEQLFGGKSRAFLETADRIGYKPRV